jgi:hypothetical protein
VLEIRRQCRLALHGKAVARFGRRGRNHRHAEQYRQKQAGYPIACLNVV